MFRLLFVCTAFRDPTCNVALRFHLPPTVGRPLPGHLVSSLTGEDKDPAESEALHVASGLTSCHRALRDGEMMESLSVRVRVSAQYTRACVRVCAYMCVSVWDTAETQEAPGPVSS